MHRPSFMSSKRLAIAQSTGRRRQALWGHATCHDLRPTMHKRLALKLGHAEHFWMIKIELCMLAGQLHKFMASLTETAYQLQGSTVLYIPAEPYSSPTAIRDKVCGCQTPMLPGSKPPDRAQKGGGGGGGGRPFLRCACSCIYVELMCWALTSSR